jgi:hypothetical protein
VGWYREACEKLSWTTLVKDVDGEGVDGEGVGPLKKAVGRLGKNGPLRTKVWLSRHPMPQTG